MRKPLSITLWVLGTTTDMRSVGELMGVAKSTVSKVVLEVITAIVHILKGKYICFPKGDELKRVIQSYKEKWGFPNCAGAVDGSHIPIIAPTFKHVDYFNRKGWHSIILQAVVNDRYAFTDLCVGWPGSVHDARVFANSSLYHRGEEGVLFGGATVEIRRDTKPLALLGGHAYPLRPWLMKGYIDNGHLSEEQQRFNYYLSRSRMTVENAFGRLKGRWRCLLKRLDIKTDNVPILITACCILHNLCQERHDAFDNEWFVEPNEGDMELAGPAPQVRGNEENEKQFQDYLCEYINTVFQ